MLFFSFSNFCDLYFFLLCLRYFSLFSTFFLCFSNFCVLSFFSNFCALFFFSNFCVIYMFFKLLHYFSVSQFFVFYLLFSNLCRMLGTILRPTPHPNATYWVLSIVAFSFYSWCYLISLPSSLSSFPIFLSIVPSSFRHYLFLSILYAQFVLPKRGTFYIEQKFSTQESFNNKPWE